MALGAAAMCFQTQYLFLGHAFISPFACFLFFGTLALYSAHRLVGLKKVGPFLEKGRYRVIYTYQKHIQVYGVLGIVVASYFFFQLPIRVMPSLIIPGIVAAGYVLPFTPKGKRLRDIDGLKIFLLAPSWAWLTTVGPWMELGLQPTLPLVVITLERCFFFFSIAIGFDIRDLPIDTYSQVNTLPGWLGIPKTKVLAGISLIAMMFLAGFNFWLGAYSPGTLLAIGISAILIMTLVYFSDRVKHDYYFSGLLDGMLIVESGLMFLIAPKW